jgi:type IV secretory pathway VirB2 component (pilin)
VAALLLGLLCLLLLLIIIATLLALLLGNMLAEAGLAWAILLGILLRSAAINEQFIATQGSGNRWVK